MTETKPLMAGKRGLIMGVANERSIAWAISKAAHAHGAELAFTYQGDALGKRVKPLAETVGGKVLGDCDVGNEASVAAVFESVSKLWGGLDFLVHAIAYSDPDELRGLYVDTTRANFLKSLEISCYSFTDLCRRAVPLMTKGGSLLTLSYLGAERVMPHYNVMGVAKAALEASVRYLAVDLGGKNIRVNAISAGPIKTLAASGIGDFRYILKWNQLNSPLKRNVIARGSGQCRPLSAERSFRWRHRRGASRRFRLPCRRHDGGRRGVRSRRDAGKLQASRLIPSARCPATASAPYSASPHGAKATGRPSAASSRACRRASPCPKATSSPGSTSAGRAPRVSPPSAKRATRCRSCPACSRARPPARR